MTTTNDKINTEVQRLLGKSYSYDGELFYRGDPCVGRATAYEQKMVAQAIKNADRKLIALPTSENAMVQTLIDASESFADDEGACTCPITGCVCQPPPPRPTAFTPPSRMFSMEAVCGFLGQRFCATR